MAALCPHLTPEEAVAAFSAGEDASAHVACPPLRVRGAFQIIRYIKPRDGEPGRVAMIRAGRTPASYATAEGQHGDVFTRYPHMERAIAYAEQEWGDHLILDTWAAYVESHLQDPTQLRPREGTRQEFAGVNPGERTGFPTTKGTLHLALARDVNDIINDHSEPGSVQYDAATVEATVDGFIGAELKGGRGGYTLFHCTVCESPLGLTECKGCGHAYGDDGWRSGSLEPLGPKLIAVVKASGLTAFPKDPAVAQATELAQWKIYQQQAAAREAAWAARQTAG